MDQPNCPRDEVEFPFPVKGGGKAPISLPFFGKKKKHIYFLPFFFPTLVTSVNSFPFPSHNKNTQYFLLTPTKIKTNKQKTRKMLPIFWPNFPNIPLIFPFLSNKTNYFFPISLPHQKQSIFPSYFIPSLAKLLNSLPFTSHFH